MLKLIGPKRTRTFRIIWLLEELDLDYELAETLPHSDEVTALNPLREVPVLVADDAVLTDSLAIGHWLTAREGRMTYPEGTIERARMDARINFVLTELEAPCWLATRHRFVLPKDRRRPEFKEPLAADFADAEAKFATLLGDAEFFAGDEFTLADIVAGHVAGWGLMQGFGHQTKAMSDYFERISARQAWKKAHGEA